MYTRSRTIRVGGGLTKIREGPEVVPGEPFRTEGEWWMDCGRAMGIALIIRESLM